MGHYSKHDKQKVVDHYGCSKCGRKHYFGDQYYRAHMKYSGRKEGSNAKSIGDY